MRRVLVVLLGGALALAALVLAAPATAGPPPAVAVTKIRAEFRDYESATRYKATVIDLATGLKDPLTWSLQPPADNPTCKRFMTLLGEHTGNSYEAEAIWQHGDEYGCSHATVQHAGTVTLRYTTTVQESGIEIYWTCTATYVGTLDGQGDPAVCVTPDCRKQWADLRSAEARLQVLTEAGRAIGERFDALSKQVASARARFEASTGFFSNLATTLSFGLYETEAAKAAKEHNLAVTELGVVLDALRKSSDERVLAAEAIQRARAAVKGCEEAGASQSLTAVGDRIAGAAASSQRAAPPALGVDCTAEIGAVGRLAGADIAYRQLRARFRPATFDAAARHTRAAARVFDRLGHAFASRRGGAKAAARLRAITRLASEGAASAARLAAYVKSFAPKQAAAKARGDAARNALTTCLAGR